MTDLPLDGARVLEIGGGLPAAFATRLLAGFGADVARTERHCIVSADEHIYLNSGKRGIAGDEGLRDLALAADIIVEDASAGRGLPAFGIDRRELLGAKPSLVLISLSPFGVESPYSSYRSTNAVSFAMGGIMSLTGDSSRPPLVTGGSHAEAVGGYNAFGAALSAYFGALVHGEGDWFDISLQDCAAGMLEGQGPRTEYTKGPPGPRNGNQAAPTWGIYPLADGYGGVCALARQIPALFRVMDDPELLEPKFSDATQRMQHPDEMMAKLFAWFSQRTKQELLDLGPKNKIPFGAVLTPKDLLESKTLAEREFFDTVPIEGGEARMPGRPFLGLGWKAPVIRETASDARAVLAEWEGVPV